ncbi:hypothetical protein [Lampropedia aestuarii]|uniref:hypothetical protein n=1 Tax=Lampropedia aestuarii TaxID=2562762 RepID=UPI002468DFFA|nr:hypothetical protein [Lampropedia aestuarii]MDH5859186.1 hypothetical protein [Lampropedia aestuarii]
MAYYEDERYILASQQLPHSGLGIASFIISVIACVVLTISVIAAGIADTSTPGGIDESSWLAGLLGLLMLTMMGALLLSLALGIAGWVQHNRKPLFAILGTSLSGAGLLGSLALMVIAFVVEA